MSQSIVVGSNENPSATVAFTYVQAKDRAAGRREVLSLREAIDEFRVAAEPRTVDKKSALLWFSPATFRDDKRDGDHFESAWALGFDVDEAPIPSADALCAELNAAGLHAWFHSSPSARTDAPRWHLFVVTSRPIVSVDEYKRAHVALRSLFGFKVGAAASDGSRAWTVPRDPEEGSYVFHEIPGAPVDVDMLLAMAVPQATRAPAAIPRDTPNSARRALAIAVGAAALAACPAVGHRHELARDLSGVLCADDSGVALDDVPGFIVEALCDVAGFGSREQKRALADGAITRKRAGESLPGWPTLQAKWPGLYSAIKAPEIARAETSSFFGRNERKQENVPTSEGSAFFRWGEWDRPVPPVAYAIGSIIPARSVCMLAAHGNSLKTWTALSLAAAVSSGEAWLGRYKVTKARAGILDYENGEHEIRRRMGILAAGQGLGDLGYRRDERNLLDPKLWADLVASGAEFLVIDGLAAGSGGTDENSTQAAVPLYHARAFVEATGGSVVFIHHANKGDRTDKREKVRGSSAIYAALDACYDFDTEDGIAAISCTKMRIGPPPESFRVSLSDEEGLTLVEREAEEPQRDLAGPILLMLRDGPMARDAIRRKLGKRAQVVLDALNALKDEGHVFKGEGERWALDDGDKRVARVYEVVATAAANGSSIPTAAKLASWAYVPESFVKRMCVEGKIAFSCGNCHRIYGE